MTRRRILFGVQAERNAPISEVVDRTRFDCDFVSFAAAQGAYDAVVPLTLDQQAELRGATERFGGRFLVPDAETEALCHDKVRFNRQLMREGLGEMAPRMSRPREAQPPFVLKRRKDEFGQRSHVVADAGMLATVGALLDDPQYFAQALVEGTEEFVSHVVCLDGEVRYQLHIAYDMAGKALIRGQAARPLRSRVLAGPPAPGLVERIVELLGYTGVGCLNYKMAGDRPKIFEFNPRFGSSLTRDVNAVLDAYLATLDSRHAASVPPSPAPV